MVNALLAACVTLGVATAGLGAYVWRHHRNIRELDARLQQRAELQARVMENLPADQVVYPHAKAAIGYVFNPSMKTGTLWAPRGRPYAINSWGLRGAEIGPKAPGRKRIVLVGDSWFFGWLIRDEDRLEDRMRALLKGAPVDVVTVALPGWNVQSEAAFLKSRMRDLDPDAVVWEICPNDTWQVGGVIPPGGLSWALSPQNRDLEANAFTVINGPLPLMPYVVDRHLQNLALLDEVRAAYGVTVLAAPVDIPPADWAFLTRKAGIDLPVHFTPRVLAADRKGWISAEDSHPTPWMNERLALGYLAKLSAMGVVPPLTLDAGQQAIVGEWERANARLPSEGEIDAHVRSVMDQVPDSYATASDFARAAAGLDGRGVMGRRGLLYVRPPGGRSALALDLEVGAYAARYRREVKVSVRTFEREEAAASREFSGAEQRVTLRVPLPATASRYPVYEVEWLFNYDECADPTRCTAARLVRVENR